MQAPDVEDIVLDALSTPELIQERADVAARIPIIVAQLQDKARRPPSPEDDSPEWDAYRAWRQRARWALAHHKRELVEIKALLAERNDTSRAGRLIRLEALAAADPATLPEPDRLYVERGERIRADLESESAEGMLLRALRVMRHVLVGHVNSFPASMDAQDIEALMLIGTWARRRYGTGRVQQFVATEAPP